MRHKHFRSDLLRNEPVSRERNSPHRRHVAALCLLPAIEVNRSGKGREHYELSEGQIGSLRNCKSRIESARTIAGESKNERAQNVYSMGAKGLQLANQVFSRLIEVFVDGLQSFWSNRLHSHQCTLYVGFLHRSKKFRIFGGFHC